jgi:hypothetical protein
MRRLARHLFTLCSALSVLLCLAVCALWVRSYFHSDELVWTTAQLGREGAVATTRDSFIRSSRGWWSHGQFYDPHEWSDGRPERSSFEWRRQAGPLAMQAEFTAYAGIVAIPYWLTTLLLLAPPAVRFGGPPLWRWGRRRDVPGLCPVCGYDLRATPGRCPECGSHASGGGAPSGGAGAVSRRRAAHPLRLFCRPHVPGLRCEAVRGSLHEGRTYGGA